MLYVVWTASSFCLALVGGGCYMCARAIFVPAVIVVFVVAEITSYLGLLLRLPQTLTLRQQPAAQQAGGCDMHISLVLQMLLLQYHRRHWS